VRFEKIDVLVAYGSLSRMKNSYSAALINITPPHIKTAIFTMTLIRLLFSGIVHLPEDAQVFRCGETGFLYQLP
jgi:hypothetical protein